MKRFIYSGLAATLAAVALTACSDWTDPEPIDVVHGGIEENDAEAYQKYLANLRQYRTNSHKKFYAWYENKGTFNSQADHVSAVPDSIDVLVLSNPSIIDSEGVYDIQQKTTNTGMVVACAVDYNAIQDEYTSKVEVGESVGSWTDYLGQSVDQALSDAAAAGINHVIAAYVGKDTNLMTSADAQACIQGQQTFFGKITSWVATAGRSYDYMGVPANVYDASILNNAGVIFLSETASVTSTLEYEMIIARNSSNGLPTDRFAVIAPLPGTDANGNAVGTWGSSYASWKAAEWSRGANVAAMGVTNLNDDYYNPTFIYPVCRGAIQILNPAAK